jgi:dipeptide/tripeptide permease
LDFAQRWQEVREGFERPFWVANITELFERLSYYGVNASLAIYLHRSLGFSPTQTGDLIGYFGGIVWLLPLVGGPLADKFGFRRMLAFAYLIMSLGYFLLGSLSASWMAPLRDALPMYYVVLIILFIPAMGPAIVKPCVVGTTARASKENVRSLGYSLYYTLVNVGGMLGPLMAGWVHEHIGISTVFRVCALSVFLMFFAVLLFFREPKGEGEPTAVSFIQVFRNFRQVTGAKLLIWLLFVALAALVCWIIRLQPPWWTGLIALGIALALCNRFMLFLVIFSGFYFVFWQEFIALPLYVTEYVDPSLSVEYLLTVDPLVVILFTIPVSYLTRKWKPFTAMTVGLLVSSFSWLVLMSGGLMPAMVWMAGKFSAAGIAIKGPTLQIGVALVVLAAGELILSPRLYEYVSRLAPPGQQGVYMGFAFLPVAIGFYTAGAVGGRLVHFFGFQRGESHMIWWIISGLGFFATLLMWIYDRVVKPGEAQAQS